MLSVAHITCHTHTLTVVCVRPAVLLHYAVHGGRGLCKLRQGPGAVILPDPARSLQGTPVVLVVLHQPGMLQHIPGTQTVLGGLYQQFIDEVLCIG